MRVLAFLVLCGIASAQQPITTLEVSSAIRVVALEGKTYHVQGIDTDGVHLWITSVDTPSRKGYLHEFLVDSGRLVRSVEIQDGDRFHPGGIATDADSIWIPVAEYRAQSTSVIQQRDKLTLALISQFPVADHIGCVAVTGDSIIGGNWDSLDFYIWDKRGTLAQKLASTTMNAYQDVKAVSGGLIGAGSLSDRRGGAIDWLELPAMKLSRRMRVGQTDQGASLTREGMTIFNGQLWLVPEDGPSRLFVFPLDPTPK